MDKLKAFFASPERRIVAVIVVIAAAIALRSKLTGAGGLFSTTSSAPAAPPTSSSQGTADTGVVDMGAGNTQGGVTMGPGDGVTQGGVTLQPTITTQTASPPLIPATPPATSSGGGSSASSPRYFTATKWPSPGSSLSSIAQITGVPLSTILALNKNITNINLIYQGQQIRIG